MAICPRGSVVKKTPRVGARGVVFLTPPAKKWSSLLSHLHSHLSLALTKGNEEGGEQHDGKGRHEIVLPFR